MIFWLTLELVTNVSYNSSYSITLLVINNRISSRILAKFGHAVSHGFVLESLLFTLCCNYHGLHFLFVAHFLFYPQCKKLISNMCLNQLVLNRIVSLMSLSMQHIKRMTLNQNRMRTACMYSQVLYYPAQNQLSLLYDEAGGSTINQCTGAGDCTRPAHLS